MSPAAPPTKPQTPPAPASPPPDSPPKIGRKLELNSKNLHRLMLAGLGLMLVGFFVIAFYGLSVLGGKSRDVVNLKAQSQSVDNELANLEQSKKQIEKYSYFKDVATTVIPNEKDQAEAILEIYQMASQVGINLQSITFPTSTLGAVTTTPSGTTKTTAANPKALTQAKPVTGIPGLYSLTLTITPDSSATVPADRKITYDKMLAFLNLIEDNRHTAQITQVNIQTGSASGSSDPSALSFSLTVNTFIKP